MTRTKPPTPLRPEDYEAIEAALSATARGRWFLAEFARRNRAADTQLLLDAIERLGQSVRRPRSDLDLVLRDVAEMNAALAALRRRIAALPWPGGEPTGVGTLDALASACEAAAAAVADAAEEVQDIAWRLREEGADAAACDQLDQRAVEIGAAQSVLSQVVEKALQTLCFLEARLASMAETWSLEDTEVGAAGASGTAGLEEERPGAASRRDDAIAAFDDIEVIEAGDNDAGAAALEPETGVVQATDFQGLADLSPEGLDEAQKEALFS